MVAHEIARHGLPWYSHVRTNVAFEWWSNGICRRRYEFPSTTWKQTVILLNERQQKPGGPIDKILKQASSVTKRIKESVSLVLGGGPSTTHGTRTNGWIQGVLAYSNCGASCSRCKGNEGYRDDREGCPGLRSKIRLILTDNFSYGQ
ncbi:hypothetical protein CBL_06110 [Carabus blaptoides fortunei]